MSDFDLIILGNNILTCRGDGSPKRRDALQDVGMLKNGAIAVKNGIIEKICTLEEIHKNMDPKKEYTTINAGDRVVMPGLIDSHTHPIYSGNRVNEFILRARGATYQEIHAAGGGIQFTVDHTRKASFDELVKNGEK
ncbi:MAG: imidazolonepropionase, partial [Vulcanimicrobiota bacterium]